MENCTCEHMRGIIKMEGIAPKRVPSTEKGLFSVIVKHVWPDITTERIDELFSRRKKAERAQKDAQAKALLDTNIGLCEEVMTPSDIDQIHGIIQDSRKRLETIMGECAEKEKKSGAACVAPKYCDIDVSVARDFKPPGTLITKDTWRHWRWVGTFKTRSVCPKMVTKAWAADGGEPTEKQSLIHVLETLWEWYVGEDTENNRPCPYDLQAVLPGV